MESTSLLMIVALVTGIGAVWILVAWLIRTVRAYLLERSKSKP
jgi:hypothetical protein